MALDSLRPKTKKLNYRKSGAAAAKKSQKRVDAEARQAKYAALPLDMKLAQSGTKERKKLLARKQG